MMLVLVCANARLIVENLIKYGVLVNPARWVLLLIPDGAPTHEAEPWQHMLLTVPGLELPSVHSINAAACCDQNPGA